VMRNVLSYSPVDDTPNELSYHGRIGLAYRPVGKPVTTLFTVKNAYERYSPVNPGAITWKLSVATDVNIALRTGHEVRVKLAHKRVEDWSYGAGLTSDADLVLTQYVYQFARVWDADVWGRVLSVHGGTAKTGAGVEIGRLFLKSLRISAGYSYAGLEDSDLGGTDLWRSGFGVRVQLIVSDWMLQELGGGRSDD